MITKQITAIDKTLERLVDETISDLLDEMFMDLEGPVSKVLTRGWIDASESIDTICVTIEDYTQVESLRFGRGMSSIFYKTFYNFLTRRVQITTYSGARI